MWEGVFIAGVKGSKGLPKWPWWQVQQKDEDGEFLQMAALQQNVRPDKNDLGVG